MTATVGSGGSETVGTIVATSMLRPFDLDRLEQARMVAAAGHTPLGPGSHTARPTPLLVVEPALAEHQGVLGDPSGQLEVLGGEAAFERHPQVGGMRSRCPASFEDARLVGPVIHSAHVFVGAGRPLAAGMSSFRFGRQGVDKLVPLTPACDTPTRFTCGDGRRGG